MSRRAITVFNKHHFPISINTYTFLPFAETIIQIEDTSLSFQQIRSIKSLRVDRNNEQYKKAHPQTKHRFNMIYDDMAQHKHNHYSKAIESLANPVLKYLPNAGYSSTPTTKLNLRFFSSMRINEHGKWPVGPKDVFMSHGIADKEYWRADRIVDFKYAVVPGPAWKRKILAGGYKGEVFITGYTKLDPLFNGEYPRVERDKPYVLWAPTHGYATKHHGRSSYPECLRLIHEIPDVFESHLSLHPTSKIPTGDKNPTMQGLVDADVIIADGGSTIYEAWALGKPVIFPDWLCRADMLSHFSDSNLEHYIYSHNIGYHAKDMKHLIKLIDIAVTNGMEEQEKEFMEQIFPTKLRGKAGETTAKALMKIEATF